MGFCGTRYEIFCEAQLAACAILASSPCVLVQPDGCARGEREGYGEPCDVTSLSLRIRLRFSHNSTNNF